MSKPMTSAQFLADVAAHRMATRQDSGLYRHLVFRQPENSWNMWFEVVTWPGSLTIQGDMGTWSFSRVEDMFTFFRSATLRINASYWGEKITSESRFGGPSRKFNMDTFQANVISSLDGYGLSETERAEVVEALEEDVFGDDESTARRALADFKHDDFEFSDSWEIEGTGYTYHYLWCLHAIVWAIQQYDAATAASVHVAAGVALCE